MAATATLLAQPGDVVLVTAGGLALGFEAVELAGAGNLTATATVAVPANAALSGSGVLTVNANIVAKTNASLAGSAALIATGLGVTPGFSYSTVIGAGVLTANAQIVAKTSATLVGTGRFTSNAIAVTVVPASAAVGGVGRLTADATVVIDVEARRAAARALALEQMSKYRPTSYPSAGKPFRYS